MSKKCVKCGNLIPDEAAFCPECGAKQEAGAPSVCPHCGAPVEAGSSFCGNCGQPLSQGSGQANTQQTTPNAGQANAQQAEANAQQADTVAVPVEVEQSHGDNQQHFKVNFSDGQAGAGAAGSVLSGKLKLIIPVAAILIGIFVFAGGLFSKPISVKADEIVNDYIRDQSSAEKKYKDKNVEITGEALYKYQFNNSQNYAIVLKRRYSGGKNYTVILDIDSKDVAKVNRVEEGDFVHAEGKCVGIVKQKDPTMISVQIKTKKLNE
jgi:hypothetical protein